MIVDESILSGTLLIDLIKESSLLLRVRKGIKTPALIATMLAPQSTLTSI
jgi:hypothetical protein